MLAAAHRPGFLTVGQRAPTAALQRAAVSGRLGRTFLVHGPAGAGKGAFVADMLALLFCSDPDRTRRPCNACAGCRTGRARTHPDLLVGSPETWRDSRGTGESAVAAARRWLAEAAGAPIAGERRVVLIERADRAGEAMQAALLKTLEEPSDRHIHILVADDASLLLPTIRSRCQALRIGPAPRAELSDWLVREQRLPADLADALARISGGLTGQALALADHPDRLDWRRRVQGELLDLLARSPADRIASIRDLLEEASRLGAGESENGSSPGSAGSGTNGGDAGGGTVGAAADGGGAAGDETVAVRAPASVMRTGAAMIIEAWVALARDLLVASADGPAAVASAELHADLASFAARVDRDGLRRFLRFIQRVAVGISQNAAPRLALEAAVLSWPTTRRGA